MRQLPPPDAGIADSLDRTFAALADPTRRAILARLQKGEATIGQLAEPFELSLPTISRHIGVLEHAGLVAKRRSAQWRTVRLEPERLKAADEWLAPYRAFFEAGFDRLATQLQASDQNIGGRTHNQRRKNDERRER